MFRNTAVKRNEHKFTTKTPSYVNATIFNITNLMKSKPGQTHFTVASRSVCGYPVSLRAHDQMSI